MALLSINNRFKKGLYVSTVALCKKNPPHLLDMGSLQLSDLGDSTSYREEPNYIEEFSAKEPSAADRRFADVIRSDLL